MSAEDVLLMVQPTKVIKAAGKAFSELFAEIVDAIHVREDWYLVRFYAEGDIPGALGQNMSEVVDATDRDGAFPLTWTELKKLPEAMARIFDLVLVRHRGADPTSTKRLEDETFETLQGRYDIVFEAFDSSEWRLGGRDEGAVETVAAFVERARQQTSR